MEVFKFFSILLVIKLILSKSLLISDPGGRTKEEQRRSIKLALYKLIGRHAYIHSLQRKMGPRGIDSIVSRFELLRNLKLNGNTQVSI